MFYQRAGEEMMMMTTRYSYNSFIFCFLTNDIGGFMRRTIVCRCSAKLELPPECESLVKKNRGLWAVCPNPECGAVIHMKFNGLGVCKNVVFHDVFPVNSRKIVVVGLKMTEDGKE